MGLFTLDLYIGRRYLVLLNSDGMFNNVVLDVVIGLVFIYLLYSLLATILQELIATNLSFRSKILEKAILRMLEDGKTTGKNTFLDRLSGIFNLFSRSNLLMDKKVAAWFYAHPLIKYLGEDNYHSKPSYITSQNFSKVLIDLLQGLENNTTNRVQQISDSIQNGIIYHLPIDMEVDKNNPAINALRSQLPANIQEGVVKNVTEINKDTKLFLQSLWLESGADITIFRQKLETWFDDTMERATGWFKRYTRLVLFSIGLILAIGFNVDTISIAKKLAHDPKLREQVIQGAGVFLEKNKQLGERLNESQKTGDAQNEQYIRIEGEYNAINAKDSAAKKAKLEELLLAKTTYQNQTKMVDSMKKDYAFISQKTNALMDSAQNMISTDISNINKMMGLGWDQGFPHYAKGQDWTRIFGWLITALAISLGAPFWFDMLNKLMKVRGSGSKGGNTETGTANAQSQTTSPNPVTVNVNTQNGEEAVG